MSLVNYKDPVLYRMTTNYNFNDPQIDLKSTIEEMKKVMVANRGLGLSANQIGIPYSIFVVGNAYDPDSIFPVINPKIVNISEDKLLASEGCLTFPGLVLKIARPRLVRVRFANEEGRIATTQFEGITGRIFQHETDHLLGKPFFASCSKLKLESAIKKAKQAGISYTYTDLFECLKSMQVQS